MLYISIGCLGFMMLIVYDLNEVYFYKPYFRPFFAAGFFLIALSTAMVLYYGKASFVLMPLLKWLWGIFAAIAFIMLIYSLFFALPFKKTYITADNRKVYTAGVYALCRHPGVLWFALFFLFFWLFTGKPLLFWAFFCFSLLNILYSWLQDKFFFPKLFNDYEHYKATTPFLIPTFASLKSCLNSIKVR